MANQHLSSPTMAANTIVVNVRTLPDALESEMYPHLTRFQRKQSETRGPALRLQFAPDETLGALKKRIERTYESGFETRNTQRTQHMSIINPSTYPRAQTHFAHTSPNPNPTSSFSFSDATSRYFQKIIPQRTAGTPWSPFARAAPLKASF